MRALGQPELHEGPIENRILPREKEKRNIEMTEEGQISVSVNPRVGSLPFTIPTVPSLSYVNISSTHTQNPKFGSEGEASNIQSN